MYYELAHGIEQISNKRDGGWGTGYKQKVKKLNEKYESVNTVSYALTDYRRHMYMYVNPSDLVIEDYDIDGFIDDPVDFFMMFGYVGLKIFFLKKMMIIKFFFFFYR